MTQLFKMAAATLGALLVVSWTAACGDLLEMGPLDPPSLQLQSELVQTTPSNLPRGDYTLSNGSGEPLLDVKDVAPEQEHEARFDLDKLDGTINLAVARDGQTVYTQKLEHTPGVPVRLIWDIELARFLVVEQQPASSAPHTGGDGGGGGKD